MGNVKPLTLVAGRVKPLVSTDTLVDGDGTTPFSTGGPGGGGGNVFVFQPNGTPSGNLYATWTTAHAAATALPGPKEIVVDTSLMSIGAAAQVDAGAWDMTDIKLSGLVPGTPLDVPDGATMSNLTDIFSLYVRYSGLSVPMMTVPTNINMLGVSLSCDGTKPMLYVPNGTSCVVEFHSSQLTDAGQVVVQVGTSTSIDFYCYGSAYYYSTVIQTNTVTGTASSGGLIIRQIDLSANPTNLSQSQAGIGLVYWYPTVVPVISPVVVYKPYGTAIGNTYDTWTGAYNALKAVPTGEDLAGGLTLCIDASAMPSIGAAAEVDAGAWDMAGIKIQGLVPGTGLNVAEGAYLSNLTDIADSDLIYEGTSWPMEYIGADRTINVDNSWLMCTGGATKVMFDCGIYTVKVNLRSSKLTLGNYEVFDVAGGALEFHCWGPSSSYPVAIATDTVRGASGTLGIYQTELSALVANLSLTQTNFAGTITFYPITLPLRLNAEVALVDGATPALDASLGALFTLSAAGNRTIQVPTNPPSVGLAQTFVIAHTASGGARTLALNGAAGGFRFGADIPLLTATSSGLTDYIACAWNSGAGMWDVVAYVKGY